MCQRRVAVAVREPTGYEGNCTRQWLGRAERHQPHVQGMTSKPAMAPKDQAKNQKHDLSDLIHLSNHVLKEAG